LNFAYRSLSVVMKSDVVVVSSVDEWVAARVRCVVGFPVVYAFG
jgi:hypothetical protein